MNLAFINPNATESMTAAVVATARQTLPDVQILGFTNTTGPASIEGKADGDAAIPGLLSLLPVARAQGADAIVIACFDDTGLQEARAQADCPVLGIGQASYTMASLLGVRFSVVTSVAAAIPVIEGNIASLGFTGLCASVRASGLPVLAIDEAAPETIDHLVHAIETTHHQDGAGCVILGCAGMSPLKPGLERRVGIPLVDGVESSVLLARAVTHGLRPKTP